MKKYISILQMVEGQVTKVKITLAIISRIIAETKIMATASIAESAEAETFDLCLADSTISMTTSTVTKVYVIKEPFQI